MAAVSLLGAMAPQAPAAATHPVTITGTGTNEVVTEFYMSKPAGYDNCNKNKFPYKSLVSAALMTVDDGTTVTDYTVTFEDSGRGVQEYGNLEGSYDTLDECNSSTDPGRGGDIRTNFDGSPAISTPPPDQVSLFQTGTGPVPASCTFDTFKELDPSSEDYGTFSVLGPSLIQAHLDGECTIDGHTDDVHLLVNVEVLAIEPDPADPNHFTVYQTSCFTYKNQHDDNPPSVPGGCDANEWGQKT